MPTLAEQLRFALGLHQRGQLSQAQAIYDEILREDPGHADALYLLGLVAYQQRQFGKALELMGRAIAASPGNAAFYANRAIMQHELRHLDTAIADYGKAIGLKPDYADAYNNRGVALRELKQLDAAVADFSEAISLNPDFAEAYNNRGIARQELKQLDAALADYDKAVALRPDYADAYNNRGAARRELKQLDAAIADYDKAIAIRPDYADAYYNRGNALRELKNPGAAVVAYDKALTLKPDYAAAYCNRGTAHQELEQLDAALADYDKAIAIKPDYAEAHNNRGNAHKQRKELAAAIADYDRATRLKADYAEAYCNRGNALRALGRPEAAIADFDKALTIKANLAEAHFDRGNASREAGKPVAAIADYDKAVSIRPDYAEAYWNKALTLLLSGDFAAGFQLYEWRWKNPLLNMEQRRFAQPLWLGDEPLHDKRILLYSEQGLGDTIQFCRYASLVARTGAQIILGVPRPLVELLKNLDGVSRLLAEGERLPDFDYHCPLLSLPLAFKTEFHTIPSSASYLHADPAKARDWRERIGERKGLKVGVVWSGGFRLEAPQGWDAVNERRNVPLDMFAHALCDIDADFFSLQKGDPAESEICGRESEYWRRGNLHNFAGDIKDFSDTAALVANLDLVISVDTSTAHLAAALGKPTWILNRFDTCWRWLLDRDDSPWYRSVKLYRQDASRSWEPVLQRVAADLAKLANEHR